MLTNEQLDHAIVHGTRDEMDFRRIVASHRDALDAIQQEQHQAEIYRKALESTLGELQTVQTAAALAGLPAQTWAGFGGAAKRALRKHGETRIRRIER